MREITINDHIFEVRALTRGEVKKLRQDGFNLVALNPAVAEDALDAAFALVFDQGQRDTIDLLPNPGAIKLWKALLAETYGSDEEKKTS